MSLPTAIGHDLSRGMTIFKKSTEQLEQTALEHERAMAAQGRVPLPGDGSAAGRAAEPDPDDDDPAELDSADEAVMDTEDGEVFDEEEARRMLTQADRVGTAGLGASLTRATSRSGPAPADPGRSGARRVGTNSGPEQGESRARPDLRLGVISPA